MRILFLAGASSIGIAIPASAQDRSSNPLDETVEQIIVTAQRREQSLSDVGLSITAIGQQELAERNVTGVDDLPRLVPGFSAISRRSTRSMRSASILWCRRS